MARIAKSTFIARRRQRSRQDDLRSRIKQLRDALNHMGQALCMFDAESKLILCNRRYAEILALPSELAQPGAPFLEIWKHGIALGLVPAEDRSGQLEAVLESIEKKTPSRSRFAFADGRVFSVAHEPTSDGGWVSTLEDVTEKARGDRELAKTRASLIHAMDEAESVAREARKAHQRLRDAFDVVPEALVLMDDKDRFVLWNRRYEELASGSAGPCVGMSFEESLRVRLADGQIPAAIGREEAWLAERLARHAAPQSQHEHELQGGRWLRVEERRTLDGGSVGIRIDITEMKLRQESFRLLFDCNPIPMWVFDRDTLQFLAVNAAMVDHYGYSRDRLLAMTILDILPDDEREAARGLLVNPGAFQNGGLWRHIKADGGQIRVAAYARSIPYEGRNGKIISVVDVTESMRTKAELRRAQEFLNLLIENIPDAIVVKDVHDRRYTRVNRATEALFGMSRAEIIGATAEAAYPSEYAKLVKMEDDELLRRGELFIDDHTVELRDKPPRVVTLTRKLLNDDKGAPQFMLSVIHDVTERKRAEERIAHLALHDPLTNLPNRNLFNQHLASVLQMSVEHGRRFAVLCIDLDRLKEVNDVFGHAAGDRLLREISNRMRAVSRDALLARLGGDEFALVVEDVEPSGSIEALTERLLSVVDDEMDLDGVQIQASLSIGAALFPDDGRDATTLLANADAALYRAKAEGRGVTRFFKPEMDQRLRERHAMRRDLGAAIDHGELSMHYQPQAEVTGDIVSFEALLRWRHPVRGSVPPGEFIPVAEDSRLIVDIGEWVLREVCREAASWPNPLGVAVNLSPLQFRHGDLPRLVHSILLETGLSANRLELEITEGVLIDDSARALSILRRLKSFGVRIAMDDFGKGYSSLSYLQSFPFDKIKIDRAFVSNVAQNPQSAAIVRGVLGLARGLVLPVLAEGVETKEELAFLAAEACDHVQGYLIGRPRPIEDYAGVIGRHDEPSALKLAGR